MTLIQYSGNASGCQVCNTAERTKMFRLITHANCLRCFETRMLTQSKHNNKLCNSHRPADKKTDFNLFLYFLHIFKVLNPLRFSISVFCNHQMLLNKYKPWKCNMYMNNQEINAKVVAYSKSLTYKLTCKRM